MSPAPSARYAPVLLARFQYRPVQSRANAPVKYICTAHEEIIPEVLAEFIPEPPDDKE